MKKLKECKVYGINLPIFVVFAAAVLAAAWNGLIPNQIIGGIAVLFTLGIILGEIGERIPIWNKYCGGGAMFTFFVCGLCTYFDIFPQSIIDISDGWMSGYNFNNTFIAFLIVGSLLGLNRKVLMKSGALFIPAILAGLFVASVLGILGGAVFGKSVTEILTAYVLPIMGGGAGAGAIPMAQVYQDVTGQDASGYLSFALAILAVGNITSVILAVILNTLGRVFPKLTGNGELLRNAEKTIETKTENKTQITMEDIAAGIFLTGGFYALAVLFGKKLLPSIGGVQIPEFAYLIIFAAFANIFKLIPDNLRLGAQRCQIFCANKLVWIQMAGCGITLINFKEMVSVLSVANITITALIVIGAVLGSALFGWIVGFYPIESGITAGLCMANMGGSGDLAVLGAAKRMNLMSYAQISSRIGGAIVLLIGSFIFQFL